MAAELILALEDQRATQERTNQQELARMEMDRQANAQEMELKSQEAEMDRRLRELRERHQQEMESLQTMDALSLHTLIAVSEGDKAPLLAELARTETFKSMTPEQILAVAAEKRPELGGALAEMAARGDSEQAKAMYERLLSEQRTGSTEMRESQREMTTTMQEMFNKALETQASVAQAFAHGGGQAPQAGPAGGAAAPAPAPAPETPAQRVIVCRRCLQESPPTTKFCPNCGETLMNEPG